ncbi:hypothetical protein SODALDRAFT_361472 [Sodiomyces alkalinus F11]|uniref:Zn(2)-C6 fungal-type domain-containing protein n=1 Tax=Sodiomyces alkalinus (strain CBS 110278 / VKM F-3762 / F11) TaxID=1314773 RepID=A0A3N2PT94_SODAK|nr:hypothetical protein SODALDRAFT_361472 [Sodiomyces alkalinus F11]ROT37739.1 hypothetical protein SODALDRAFT_361472 [Sodiomyces alkalinus F11]
MDGMKSCNYCRPPDSLPRMMNAKRLACDRCHAMKMQCKTDGSGDSGDSGQGCARCRKVKAPCNDSEPC